MGLPLDVFDEKLELATLSPPPSSKKESNRSLESIGPYQVIQSLGRGGMGEVFLVKDPSCGRKVALKRIRPELQESKTIQSRFLREAYVASALTHPSIVPIFSIEKKEDSIYYTMPFIEGETLRQILRKTREAIRNAETHPIGSSILSLSRIFLQVCEAIAYTHSKKIIHRDLKPENIIVGKYGEVMILDWGIADFIEELPDEESFDYELDIGADLTRPGKIAGTLAYMPPERLQDNISSTQTDLYALGVILYQMLTLQLPFQRKSLALFRKTAKSESLVDPVELAPYREIPPKLSLICKRCLATSLTDRYQSVEELIVDLKNYIEGKPEWIFLKKLDPQNREDWQFQEHLLLTKHIAITHSLEVAEWAFLMISKSLFPDNLLIEAKLKIERESQGLGILLSVVDAQGKKSLEEGYCLWIGSEQNPSCKLFRNNILVAEAKGHFISKDRFHSIRIEKNADQIRFFLDQELKISFTSHLPLAGSYLGILHKDDHFILQEFRIYDRSNDVVVGCLAVPNAFLTHKLYDLALTEYRRIGQAFPGRLEGQEALFRAGLTLLEKGKGLKEEKYIHQALKEFEKLYRTPGAPLEYLGKSLAYEALGDLEEEAKCLELGLRRFPKHPRLFMLKEQILYRLHQSSLNNREATYRILLLSLRHIPEILENPDTKGLLDGLEENWEELPFIEKSGEKLSSTIIQLAFWLAATPVLTEIVEVLAPKFLQYEALFANALFCLVELKAFEKVENYLHLDSYRIQEIKKALLPFDFSSFKPFITKVEARTIYRHMSHFLQEKRFDLLEKAFQKLQDCKMSSMERLRFDALMAWSYLIQNKKNEAEKIFRKAPLSLIAQETSPLHFPYGTWLFLEKGEDAAFHHFQSVLETPYPQTTALPSHFLTGKIDEKRGWISRAFWWEKKELYRQLDLFELATRKKIENRSKYSGLH